MLLWALQAPTAEDSSDMFFENKFTRVEEGEEEEEDEEEEEEVEEGGERGKDVLTRTILGYTAE